MSARIRLDDLKSDDLDALYERLERAEGAVARVRALAADWDAWEPPPGIGLHPGPQSLRRALDEPTAEDPQPPQVTRPLTP